MHACQKAEWIYLEAMEKIGIKITDGMDQQVMHFSGTTSMAIFMHAVHQHCPVLMDEEGSAINDGCKVGWAHLPAKQFSIHEHEKKTAHMQVPFPLLVQSDHFQFSSTKGPIHKEQNFYGKTCGNPEFRGWILISDAALQIALFCATLHQMSLRGKP